MPHIKQDIEGWLNRALVDISSSKEVMQAIESKNGRSSLFKSLAQACEMGLQIGGYYKHAHLIAFSGKVELCPTADGMAFAAAHGPGAILEHAPQIVAVHELDDFVVDQGASKVDFKYSPHKDRGAIVGYFAELVYIGGRKEIKYVSMQKVESVRDNYSNKNSAAWKKSPDDMLLKIATKLLLKSAAAKAEGVAMMLSLENVADRADDRIDEATKSYDYDDDFIDVTPEPEPEPEPEVKGVF